MNNLKDKNIIVTGASGGIGNSIIKRLNDCGAIEAGYEKDRARITASELQNPKKFPLVVKYIGDIREKNRSWVSKQFLNLER